MEQYISLFIVAVINYNKDMFNYGKQYRLKTFKRHKIMLPIDDGNPDYNFMEQYMINLEKNKLNKSKEYIENKINQLKFKKFQN